MKRMVKRSYQIHYKRVLGANFSIGIALPATSLVNVTVGGFLPSRIIEDLEKCFEEPDVEIAPWRYCRDLDASLQGKELKTALLEEWRKNNTLCKKELFTNLVHDCYHINNISKRWGHFGDAVEKRNVTTVQSDALEPDKLNLTSFGVKLLFFATRNGLTKYRSSSTDATGFITNNTDTLDAVYYRRAMEGVEMLEGQPRYRYTYSVLLNRAFSNVSTMVTIVAPVARAENNMRSRLSVAGVVGMQMKYEALSSRFLQETSYGPVNCATNGFKCYLVDNQGYIVASKTPKDQVGKFFGDVENSVMLQLLINGVFYGHEFTDYQALCDIKESQTESNAASMLLNPIKSLIRGIVLLFTEFVIMISEFSLSSIINNIRGDDSLEYDHHDLNHNCSSFREEYDQSEKSLSEQLAYNQQVLMLCANSNSRGKVVSQKPCHKTFMLYRANLSMVTLPFLGNISGCKYTEAGDCHSPDVPDVDDIDRRCPRIQKDKLNISYIYRAYAVSHIEETNLLLITVDGNCTKCEDSEEPDALFQMEHAELKYILLTLMFLNSSLHEGESMCRLRKMRENEAVNHECYDSSPQEETDLCSLSSQLSSPSVLLISLAVLYADYL
ncbi:hypothetical protein DPMN_004300 [Dreissena polymorpha]|uniref:Voltage-dependent calcium channel alpha-2/delta subunit conserved region domain-containing protein n=1 Tax=Dreissena polymorpha TaxID=45954 RepID=A0A9D4MQ39_DREPO|nr:hypothetical protein DPMN_004300 [Dreissena polymorpha]